MERLLPLLIVACLLRPYSAPTPRVLATGEVCTYDPGVMERVAKTRRLSLAGTLGGVALREREHLGKLVYLQRPDGVIEGPYRVVDWWNPEGPHPPRSWAVDVGWNTWARWLPLRQGPRPGGCLPGIQVLYYDVPLEKELRAVGRTGARKD